MSTATLRTLSDDDAEWVYRRHPKLRGAPEHYCRTCAKTGVFVMSGQPYNCDCAAQMSLHKLYLDAGVGTPYQRLDWGDLHGHDKLVGRVVKYLESHGAYVDRGLGWVFSGDVGRGKSLLANLMLKDLIKRGYRCYSTTFAGCIEQFTAGWYDNDQRVRFAEKFQHSDVLLLDDLGRSLRTKNNLPESTFDYILRTRVQEGKPTLLTTNMGMEELCDGYGSAALSLLTEVSIYAEMDGEDFRPRSNRRTLDEVRSGWTRPIC